MSGWTVPPDDAVPPRAGAEPPPNVGMPEEPKDEHPERTPTHHRQGEEDGEEAQQVSTAELRRDAERTRDRLNQDMVDLRRKVGLDHEHGDGPGAGGLFAPVRRHPMTVALATAGGTAAIVIGLKMVRSRRKNEKRRMKDTARRSRIAQRRLTEARDMVAATAARGRPNRGRSGWRRLAHR